MKLITSTQNEQLKHLVKLLSQAKARREHQQTVLEGVHLLQTYIQAGFEPLYVYIPEKKINNEEVAALLPLLPPQKVILVSSDALAKISSLVLGVDVMSLITLPEQGDCPVNGDCVVIEKIQDPGNLGTIMRTAAAAGINHLILSHESVDVWSPKVLRSGMGAHFLLNISIGIHLEEWIDIYQDKIRVTALNENNNYSLYDLDLNMPSAWIFGNEGSGVSENILSKAKESIRIPMMGATESLNVAMAATVCLFEQMRQRLLTVKNKK